MLKPLLLLGLCMTAMGQRPFYAMDNGLTKMKSCDEKAKVLKELGYAGIGWRPGKQTKEMLAALDKYGLKMFSSYIGLKVDARNPTSPSKFAKELKLMKPHGSIIWLFLQKGAGANDEIAVKLVIQMADLASKYGLRVSIYPHRGFYVSTAADSLRIAKKVNRPDVGACFNLCHFLLQNDSKDLETTVRSMKGYLTLISTNGADNGRNLPLNKAIQRLDQGTFDNRRLIKVLDEIGYKGPIALQSYRIAGKDQDSLKASMNAWKDLNKEEQ